MGYSEKEILSVEELEMGRIDLRQPTYLLLNPVLYIENKSQKMYKRIFPILRNAPGSDVSFGYSGTCFFISKSLILTASHVVPPGSLARLLLADGQSFEVSEVAVNRLKDLYLGQVIGYENAEFVDPSTLTTVALASNVTFEGFSKKSVAGFDLGEFLRSIEFDSYNGLVSAIRQFQVDKADNYETAKDFYGFELKTPGKVGNSGGPALDEKGNLVGLFSAVQDDPQIAQGQAAESVFVGFEEIRSFLTINQIIPSEETNPEFLRLSQMLDDHLLQVFKHKLTHEQLEAGVRVEELEQVSGWNLKFGLRIIIYSNDHFIDKLAHFHVKSDNRNIDCRFLFDGSLYDFSNSNELSSKEIKEIQYFFQKRKSIFADLWNKQNPTLLIEP